MKILTSLLCLGSFAVSAAQAEQLNIAVIPIDFEGYNYYDSVTPEKTQIQVELTAQFWHDATLGERTINLT
ncbi:MAG: hypothetical protein HC836_40635, partial [Richelia sp. RM2_1_2]|nr:hypothetical protein [Richelia sp. RM2_1_2]